MSAPLSIFSYWKYVAPASILAGPTPEQLQQPERELTLREEASSDGLTWVRVVRQLDCKSLYFVQVAASPDLDDSLPAFLTEDQLRFALPWDARLQGRIRADGTPDAERILSTLYAHHAALQPAVRRPIAQAPVEVSVQQLAAIPATQEDQELTALPPIFVSERHMKKVLGPKHEEVIGAHAHHHAGPWGRFRTWLTTTLLKAALHATLRCRFLHDALSQALKDVQQSSQQIVSVSEVEENGRRIGWWVIVGVLQQPPMAA